MEPARPARWVLPAFLLVTGLLRTADVWRPVDGTTWNSWREVDVAAIARNFYREGMDLSRPRIDWRGDGPGFVESELPLYPWTVAHGYRWFGYHEEIARVLSLALALVASLFFFLLARDLLAPAGLAGALAFWALNPLGVRMSTSVQPEPLMAAAVLGAVYFFRRWLVGGLRASYALALGFTVLAVLAKIPALYVGVLFAALVLDRFGPGGLRRTDVWAFAGVTLAATLAWYVHARHLYLAYGNSLGASNEAYRLISAQGLVHAARWALPGNLRNEVNGVWTLPGALLGVAGLLAARREAAGRLAWYWLLALAALYLVAGRTTGQGWALYYHVASVPLAALAVGLGTAAVGRRVAACSAGRGAALAVGAASIAVGWLGVLLWALAGRFSFPAAAAFAAALGGAAFVVLRRLEPAPAGKGAGRVAWAGAAAGCLLVGATLSAEARRTWSEVHPRGFEEQFACAQAFVALVEPGALVVASGGAPTIEGAQALDAPYYFFWMDRKGFSLHRHSDADVEAFRARGARYLVAEREFIEREPAFEGVMRARYPLLAECRGNLLFGLSR